MTYSELSKILLDKTPSRLLSNQYIKEKLFELIPELEECDGFDQHSEWHPYDVFLHICHVVDDVDNTLPLRLAALFHDIGKPRKYNPTYVGDKEIGHFPLHWEESCLIFKNFAKEYNIDEETVNLVSRLIYHHDHRFKYPETDTQLFEELNK